MVFWNVTTYRPSVMLEALYSMPHNFSTEQGRNYRLLQNVHANLPGYKELESHNSGYNFVF